MLLSKETTLQFNKAYANIINHMCYAAYKLWNVCNYERVNYKQLVQDGQLTGYPDLYYQKAVHKDNIWFKSLPSQTAQEVCKLLDKGWKSFYKLQQTGVVENCNPPKYKHNPIPITYMQNGIQHGKGYIRLSIPKQLKEHMLHAYGIKENYIFIHNQFVDGFENIKQIKLYPVENGTARAIIIYEVQNVELLYDNRHYLSIDMGLHNLMTCYDSKDGSGFIIGRQYLSICRKYDKAIGKVQNQWYAIQNIQNQKKEKPVEKFYPKSSKHIKALYKKKNNCIGDYLHKMTREIVDYCVCHKINAVVIGDLTGIRKDNHKSKEFNQQMHGLPFAQIYTMLEYKLNLKGIAFIKQKEHYTSQCSPNSAEVSRACANPNNRVKRGLYRDGASYWNADSVGAYNILRLASQNNLAYFSGNKIEPPTLKKVSV